MGWRDFVPDSVEDVVEEGTEKVGDAIEWAGDKTAGFAEDVGLDDAGDWIRDKSRSAANQLGADVAELELGQTEDPKRLVYGSVSKIRAQVSHLNDFKASFDKVGGGLKGMGEPDGLKGKAADSFREAVSKEPPRWFKAADAFGKAADAMGRFAETVEWAQGQAKEALADYQHARKVSTDARAERGKLVKTYNDALRAEKDPLPPRPPDEFTDPGTALAAAAQDKLATARKQRNDVAETVRTAVRAARDAAPPKPSYAKQLGDGMDYMDLAKTHLAGGVIKGTAGIVNFARALNPMDPYNLTHPAEYVTNLNSTAAGLVTMANDPMGAGKKMLDEFMKDPSEGFGKLIPELVGSKGLGSLKKIGSAAKHGDDLKGPGRTGLDKDGPGSASRTGKDTTCVDDPVDVATGRMVLPQTDLALPGSLPLAFTRTFESSYQAGRWFGRRWASTIDQRLEIDAVGIVLVGEDGSILAYPHPAPGVPVLPTHGRRWPLSITPEGEFTVTDPETGRVWHFTAEGILVQLDDRNGAWIAYEYDADGTPTGMSHSGGYRVHLTTTGRITSLSLADGTKVLDYAYTDGDLTEVINSSGLPLRFGYDEHARIVSWTDTNGRHFDYTYDDQDRCTAQSGTNGHVDSRFTYGDGVTTVIGALGYQRRYVVDDRSLVVAETDANGATTRFEWGPFNRLLKRTDPLGLATRITYDDNGLVTSVERTDGRLTAMQYNALGLPERVTRPDGTSVRRTYDERGNPLSVSGTSGADTRYTYDDRGHLSSVTNALGETSSIRCNAAGLVVESANPLGAVTRYTYDAFGRAATVTDPLGGVTRLTWSVEGRLLRRVEPDGSEQSWVYDGEGNCLTHTDANGGRSVYEFGDFDALVARTGPDGARYSFAHDLELRLTEVTNPQGLTWTYEYDPGGRLTSETDFDGRTLNYAYDAANRLAARTNALGETVRYEYNALGQTARKDAAGAVTTYEYDHADQLARAVGPDVTLTRVRNREGLLHSETVNGRTLSYAYDELGRTARRVTPSGTVSEWSYDAAGRRATLMASGRTLTFEHDAMGRETVRRIGAGVTLSHGFDEVGRLTEQHLTGIDGRTLQRRGYTYRPDGHLTAVDDALGGVRIFTLDAAARVTSVEAGTWTERYAYDEAGNQTSASWPISHPDAGSAAGPRTYTGNRIVSAGGVRYEHDVQGRVVLRQKARLSRKPDTWHYSWDAEDRLVGVTTPDGTVWRYIYDPLGRRAAKQCLSATGEVVEEVVFTWEGANLCEQTTHSAELPHPVALTWEHRGLHPLTQTERILAAPREEIDSRFFSIVTDLVGTPTELVDERGEVAWRTRSTLWGATTWNRDASTYTPLRFPGQYFDPESGLHYNVFRTYDPETARYLSPDPLGLAPAPNPMAYVHNPHTWSDHLGLAPDECRVTVYRKQTEHPLSQRVHIDENGNVTIDGNNHLYVNMSGELRHTVEFRGDNGQIVAFDVPKSFVDDIRARAVPQEQPDGLGFTKQEWKQVKQIYPEISDPTRGTDLYGLPGEVLDQMRKVIIPGSGRIVQDP